MADLASTRTYDFSIKALRPKTLDLLSSLLNPPKIILTDKGLPRDWNGLADLIGIGGEQIPNLQNDLDQTQKLLSLWLEKDKHKSSIATLLLFLESLDRFDIIDDLKLLIDEDIKVFESVVYSPSSTNLDFCILTRDDVVRIENDLEPQKYDAFVLFADEDTNFATELIDKMENQYKLKLCAKDRDLIVGVFEHESVIKLIAERCNRLIAIISPAFLESASNKFFCNFAQSLGIEQRVRKIIPCLYTPCQVPPELSCYFMLDYQRQGKLSNFWERLRDSIKSNGKNNSLAEQPMFRSVSQQIPPISENNSITVPIDYTSVKLKKEGVKFTSMINLNYTKNEKILNSISEMSSLPTPKNEKQNKAKTGWDTPKGLRPEMPVTHVSCDIVEELLQGTCLEPYTLAPYKSSTNLDDPFVDEMEITCTCDKTASSMNVFLEHCTNRSDRDHQISVDNKPTNLDDLFVDEMEIVCTCAQATSSKRVCLEHYADIPAPEQQITVEIPDTPPPL
ncbi:hypothetical protein FQA39_LY18300 [Lamprigera yunnana]|nr:hypothetical protein FQA39_LY18300 [Lamprigera yunnana]